jgi:hypothetical protein
MVTKSLVVNNAADRKSPIQIRGLSHLYIYII